MPKRKRSVEDDVSGPTSSHDRIRASRQRDVDVHIENSKKLLHRALKKAKGFERQKLGKRLTNATKISDAPSMARMRKEIEVVKSLDLDRVVESRLCKGIGKIKALVESGYLPKMWTEGEVKGWEGEKSEEEVKAWNNVVSGIWNLNVVKEVWTGVVRGFYLAMGVQAPVEGKGKKQTDKEKEKATKKDAEKNRRAPQIEDGGDSEDGTESTTRRDREPSWEGFDSPADDEDGDSDSDAENNKDDDEGNDSLDEETLSHYDALLANSSDEESFDEEEYLKSHPSTSKPSTRLSLSLSPSLSRSPSPSYSLNLSNSASGSESDAPPPTKAKQPKPSKTAPAAKPTTGSTFLPTLMGGYWSGSESPASDLSDSAVRPPVRKNRMGQQARRALAEKKFGTGANHIKAGKPSVNIKEEKGKDKGRKRGEKFGNDRGRGRGRDAKDNANLTEVKPREKTRDDVGVLHPSWQAAKKAKEEKLKATFQGKKVTFD
ncbi:Bud-site selection BUD22 protein [Rutstroemia sp. NJR-2017a BVV2]|nr:Bud-site selection BUD22 protein [Rutstroemia sp. NJR-2017a BVV2]